MKVHLLSREYPPYVYGGAGVHVTELAQVLKAHAEVSVHCFEGERKTASNAEITVRGYDYVAAQEHDNAALRTLGVDLLMAQQTAGADIVHSHTWYANMAGHWAKLLHDIPHVVTAHSLEPLRPWKAEQLGGGYRLSSWAEKTAYEAADAIVAVSHGMKADILKSYPQVNPEKVSVIHNGLDLNSWQLPTPAERERVLRVAAANGVDPDAPTLVFVGRVTRQKGLPHLLRALAQIPPGYQVVLCAGAPDTPQIASEVEELVAELRSKREGIVLIEEMLPHQDLVDILSLAQVFVTPSIYEPMGIVNLEAMAMELPVVGTRTGGIPDCIEEGKTGLLIPIEQMQDGTGTPLDPAKFEADMAERLTYLLENPQLCKEMGKAGRKRVEEHFSWEAVAEKTYRLYQSLL